LGLAIVKSIVERHDGSVSVRSTPGIGSQFIVRLPLARSAAVVG
jgi:two-component system OmpR family sensor kinase